MIFLSDKPEMDSILRANMGADTHEARVINLGRTGVGQDNILHGTFLQTQAATRT
jgi:hypothetical protein